MVSTITIRTDGQMQFIPQYNCKSFLTLNQVSGYKYLYLFHTLYRTKAESKTTPVERQVEKCDCRSNK